MKRVAKIVSYCIGLLWLAGMSQSVTAAPARAGAFTGFDDFIARYRAAETRRRQPLIQGYIEWQQANGGFPVTGEEGGVVFVYFADDGASKVNLAGDFYTASEYDIYWKPGGEPMERAGDVFYKRLSFEPDARLDYRFVVGEESVPDPLNPRKIFSGAGRGEASELVMPEHRLPVEVKPHTTVPKGRLQVVDEPWALPKITVYLPPGYSAKKRYPTIYTADGSAWVDYLHLPTILDNLIAGERIEPVIAVMIDAPENRGNWYRYNPRYLAYLERVVEYVDSHYGTRVEAAERLHAGTSAGGRATLYVGLERPDLFGKLGILSPALSGPIHYLEPWFSGRKQPDPALHIWMGAGSYEQFIYRDTRTISDYLARMGVKAETIYTHQGHSFGAWSESAIQMTEYFFATR